MTSYTALQIRKRITTSSLALVLLPALLVLSACSLQPPTNTQTNTKATTEATPQATAPANTSANAPAAATATATSTPALPDASDINWGLYLGQYPRDSDAPQPYSTAFLQLPYIAEAIARALPAQAVMELAQLQLEVPITSPAPGYLQVHLCEAHNCGHAVDLLVNTQQLLVTAVFYQPIENPPSMVIPCHSNQVTRVGGLPLAVQQALSLRIIAEEDSSIDMAELGCYRRPLR